MRTTLILAMFTASLASAGWGDYEETRNLKLDAGGLDGLAIEAGSGSLEVLGIEGAGEVAVIATIRVPDENDKKAQQIISDDLVLVLEKTAKGAMLKGYFEGGGWGWSESGSVRLEVQIPSHFELAVEDSSGSIVIVDVSGDITVDDSSGSIEMRHVGGSIEIDDSSGSISVHGVGADLDIEDGSGSIVVREVAGSVLIDDGSGSVTITDVGKDLIITESGSGSVRYSNIKGTVETDT